MTNLLFLPGLPLKDIQTEVHLYHCMALVANSLNFTWSRWNLLSGYDKLIMQYRERLPGAPEVNHQVIGPNSAEKAFPALLLSLVLGNARSGSTEGICLLARSRLGNRIR